MTDHLKLAGERIVAKVYPANAALDPTVITGIISAIIALIQQCRENRGTPEAIKQHAANRRIGHVLHVRRQVAQEMGLRRFRDRSEIIRVADALLDEAAGATVEEIQAVSDEIL